MPRRLTHDEAAAVMRAAGLAPLEPYPGSRKRWRCRCLACGREFSPLSRDALTGRTSCPYCAGTSVAPDIAVETMRLAGLEPETPFPGSGKPWPCVCQVCGNAVSPRYDYVRSTGRGCRRCANRRDPQAMASEMRALGFEPSEPYPGASAPWLCQCSTCRNYSRPRLAQTRAGVRCGFCAGKAVSPEEAETVMRAAGLDPLVPYPGTKVGWLSRCRTCGKEVRPHYGTVRMGSGCVWCAGVRLDPETAEDDMRAVGLEPLEPYPGTVSPWRCRCRQCGREVSPQHRHVRNGTSGCKYCQERGYWAESESAATVYLLHHETYGAVKIGVMREHTARLADHERQGWHVLAKWSGLAPSVAYDAEQAVIAMWRAEGIPDAVAREDMPQSGHTETAPLDLVDLARTRQVIAATIAAAKPVDPGP